MNKILLDPKWITLSLVVIGMIFGFGIWYNQTQVYAATVSDHASAIQCLADKLDSIDKRLSRIEWKLDLED